MPETLVIGLGGAGAQVCRRLADRVAAGAEGEGPAILVVDTDRSDQSDLAHQHGIAAVTLGATAALLDAAYRAPDRFHAGWVDPEVLRGRGTTDEGTQGRRMLGRFLLLLPDNLAALQEAVAPALAEASRVYVVAGAAGGTGSGMLADLGYWIRREAARRGQEPDLRAIFFIPPPDDPGAANAVAALKELHYYADPDTRYHAHFGEEQHESRGAPYARVHLLTSLTPDGYVIPLPELQERAAVYLFTATVGDPGDWARARGEEERKVEPADADGNPQAFATFGTEWVEYPEERLVRAVYRNLLRRSLIGWLHGDRPAQLTEVPARVMMRDAAALAQQLTDAGGSTGAPERLVRAVQQRLPGLHKAAQSAWLQMDRDLETAVLEAIGVVPAPGRRAKGPIADRARAVRDQAISEVRRLTLEWLSRDGLNLDRVGRVLHELANEVTTTTDPIAKWEGAREATREARRRVLWAAGAVRRDPFLMFSRTPALQGLAREYGRVAAAHAMFALQAAAVPFMRELRTQVQEPARLWAERIQTLHGLLGGRSRAWADEESACLERLRAEEEAGRLALGLLDLPGRETPYVANSGWDLPYAGAEDEAGAITDLRRGWISHLAERENGLLAGPGRSALDGPGRLDQAVNATDQALQALTDERLRAWLSATVFQRLAEQYREPVELEFQLRRMVGKAAELPALEPPHARPGGFPSEYELVFFEEAKTEEFPAALRMVVDQANRDRPTEVMPSRSAHYLTAITEHAGFSLARCPAFFQLSDRAGDALPFSRRDLPWRSATLLTRARRGDASDILFLALSFGILHPNPDGEIPLPSSVIPAAAAEWRFPLPGEFDLAVRQLAGDPEVLSALGLAVDRTVQSKGVEWCSLQVERGILDGLARVRFPGEEPARTARLAAYRASARYDELQEELARSGLGRDAEWLRAGERYACASCGHDLGADPDALHGACPACRAPLVLFKLAGQPASDGFRRIPNPYVVGTPLETGASVFVGREDIVQQVRERLIRPAQRTILILIGERRSGKTSALKQLQYRLEGDLTPLFVDMQGLTATDLSGFLWWLAWRMKEALDERGIPVELPSWEQFSAKPPDFQFETVILPEIRRKLHGGRVLLMLDEFEVLAQRVMKGTFDGRAFDYLRHLMQHSDGLEFLFAGTHILRQFAANYVTFLFNIGVFLDVDFLTPKDALRLIQEPVAPAGVTYTPEALESVLELAGSHPYFTQLFAFHLVERLNHLRKRNVTREDVEAESGPVIAAAGAHLDHVWGQLSDTDRLLIAFFAQETGRGESVPEDALLQSAIRDDASIRPYQFRASVEKLVTVGLLRAGSAQDPEGRPARTVALTAEVYRQWLETAHPYKRLREEGLEWEGNRQ